MGAVQTAPIFFVPRNRHGAPHNQQREMTVTDAFQQAKSDFVAALNNRDRAGANRAANRLIDLGAPMGKTWKSVATVLERNGEHDDAVRAMRLWHSQSGKAPEVAMELSGFLARAGRHDEARALTASSAPGTLSASGQAYLEGTLATNRGDSETAREHLGRAVALDPASGQAWIALSMIGPLSQEHASLLTSSAGRFANRNDADAAAYFYAVGRHHHACKDHEAAFAAFDRGARIMQGLTKWDRQALAESVRLSMDGWTTEAVDRLKIAPVGQSPIFVTGLPRSGTTLTEQILVSNSKVVGGEELNLFHLLQQDLGASTLENIEAFARKDGALEQLRATYLRLVAQKYPGPGIVVDKTLLGSRVIGLLAVLFPEAPIVWLRRDPADTAWSAFSTWFLHGVDYSWSFERIADFFNDEDRLLKFWTELLGNRLLVVPYRELVTEPDRWIPQIDEYCGLPFEDQQMTPHLSQRIVSTASVSQVRQPINTKGLGSSAPYHRFMGAFFDRYEGGSD